MAHFTHSQTEALSALMRGGENVFITGVAGSGKTFLIREFLKNHSNKTFPVLASTGVAAVLLGGRTFHSFFGLGIMDKSFAAVVDKAAKDRRVASRLRQAQGIVIDEISMLDADTLRAGEAIARATRRKQLPWGGLRVIAVGDFAQLPPVSRETQKKWVFDDDIWDRSGFLSFVLNEVVRSADENFLQILNDVRAGDVTPQVSRYLNSCLDELGYQTRTVLLPFRAQAERINEKRLLEVENRAVSFPTEYGGNEFAIAALKKNAPISENLVLKVGARIMIRVNDPAQRYVNGSIGQVAEITPEWILVALKNGKAVTLEKHRFSWLDADGNESGFAINFPLSLAYAFTIHKAQGLTLEELHTDLRSLWEPGQAYVALSRLKSGAGLTLSGWEAASIRADERVKDFYRRLSLI